MLLAGQDMEYWYKYECIPSNLSELKWREKFSKDIKNFLVLPDETI